MICEASKSIVLGDEATFHPQNFQSTVFSLDVGSRQLFEAGVDQERHSHFTAFHIDDVENSLNDLLLQSL